MSGSRHDLLAAGRAERGSRLQGARVALALGPLGRLADELTQLGEERRDSRSLSLERLDPLQPGQNRARLLHAPKVGGKS